MSIRNKVQLVGHVGQNPEIKTFGDSGKLARLSVATNESYKNKNGEWIENTSWHSLIAWRNIANRIEKQIQKGAYILIDGKLVNRSYTDNENVKRYITEVEIQNFMILDKKTKQGNEMASKGNASDFYKPSADDSDLPF